MTDIMQTTAAPDIDFSLPDFQNTIITFVSIGAGLIGFFVILYFIVRTIIHYHCTPRLEAKYKEKKNKELQQNNESDDCTIGGPDYTTDGPDCVRSSQTKASEEMESSCSEKDKDLQNFEMLKR